MLLNDFFYIERQDTAIGGCLSVTVRLNPGHEIFQAHFPGQPITPGVCQIQMVIEILAHCLEADVSLTDIKHVKYLSVIKPDATPQLTVCFQKLEQADGTCQAVVTIGHGGQTYTKMSMTCQCRPRSIHP